MPGREELIQQNLARARTGNAAQSSAPEQKTGKAPAFPSHRSLLGANLDVALALSEITFASGPEGDYAMRNSIAFIRKWKRGNSAQISDSTSAAAAPQGGGFWDNLDSNVSSLYNSNLLPNLGSEYKLDNLGFNSSSLPKFDASAFSATVPSLAGIAGGAGANSLNNLAFSAPGVSIGSSYNSPGGFIGQAKSANPWGYFSRFLGGLFNAPGRATYSGVLGEGSQARYGGGTVGKLSGGGALPDGIWQFLFNPSEIELSAGPEFKQSEVWAVSEKENSGQPLHWSNNKNAELKFNSVILNGYIFGKQVEELEQGIIELFMARDGEGQDGPHVLEFVWGERVFGPCMIKDITVKEKMWDSGRVVNADLSFTLVQVPEWTINDGFVDVARPGRAAPITPAAGGTGATTAPPGGGSSPDQKAKKPNS